MKRIAIFGAGIGGLTVAHQLSKFPEYTIDIYEKKDDIGGLARSQRDKDGCCMEYSWRVFFGFYNNLLRILQEIPLISDPNKNVLNNLDIYRHINLSDSTISIKDKTIAIYNILYGICSCDNRLDELDNLKWWDALGLTSNSNVFREIGPWLGMSRYDGSYKSVIKVGFEMQILNTYLNPNYKDYVTTKSTSEAWFDNWKQYLINKGVKFHMETELMNVYIQNNKITSATVHDDQKNNNYNVIADEYIFGIPVEMLDKIITNTPYLNYGQLTNIKKLKDISLHTQLGFQLYFNKQVSLGTDSLGKKNNAFLVVDSPWDLIILSYDNLYKDTKLCSKLTNVKGGWSVVACTSYVNGIVYNKPMDQCNYDEIIKELWAQLISSPKLKQLVKQNNNFEFDEKIVVKFTPMWPTFNYNQSINKLISSEPKFTNNAGTYALRPSFKTHIQNLYISTAYTKEAIDIFSMEAACIAGKNVANAIDTRSPTSIMIKRPKLFEGFRSVDNALYNNKLPGVLPTLSVVVLILLLLLFSVVPQSRIIIAIMLVILFISVYWMIYKVN